MLSAENFTKHAKHYLHENAAKLCFPKPSVDTHVCMYV